MRAVLVGAFLSLGTILAPHEVDCSTALLERWEEQTPAQEDSMGSSLEFRGEVWHNGDAIVSTNDDASYNRNSQAKKLSKKKRKRRKPRTRDGPVVAGFRYVAGRLSSGVQSLKKIVPKSKAGKIMVVGAALVLAGLLVWTCYPAVGQEWWRELLNHTQPWIPAEFPASFGGHSLCGFSFPPTASIGDLADYCSLGYQCADGSMCPTSEMLDSQVILCGRAHGIAGSRQVWDSIVSNRVDPSFMQHHRDAHCACIPELAESVFIAGQGAALSRSGL